MTQIYCATSNPGKLAEFRLAAEAVPDAPPVLIDLLPGFAAIPPCVEDGATFEENALIKARHYGRHTAGLLFADDSGLVVDALHGAPGVHSARFSGPGATNRSNNGLLLEKLRGIEHRTAAFVCAIALVKATEPVGVFTGRVEGVILDEPRGANGFGYDPLFFYPPFGCTFGEAGETAKFAVSHRGQALREMLRCLSLSPAPPRHKP
ncbi:MAG: RdgB/HAM1 family non-canonical purine NTP pyrophosphatase [Bryobacteraceae bacterium]